MSEEIEAAVLAERQAIIDLLASSEPGTRAEKLVGQIEDEYLHGLPGLLSGLLAEWCEATADELKDYVDKIRARPGTLPRRTHAIRPGCPLKDVRTRCNMQLTLAGDDAITSEGHLGLIDCPGCLRDMLRELREPTKGDINVDQVKSELAADVYRACHITGTFKLRSGLMSNEYFDKYLFESDPALLRRVISAMSRMVVRAVPEPPDYLAGLEMGGIPLVTMLSNSLDVPALFVRKQAKEYGTCKLAEGPDVSGKKVVLVEDVVTTGGQIIKSAEQLRELGAEIEYVVAVIDREKGGAEKLTDAGLRLRTVFTASQLDEAIYG